MLPVHDSAERYRARTERSALAGTKAAMATLAAAAFLLLSAAQWALASASGPTAAPLRGSAAAAANARLTITGTIAWKQTISLNDSNATGQEIQTGTFNTDGVMSSTNQWNNTGGRYQVSDSYNKTIGPGGNCPTKVAASASAGGDFPPGVSNGDAVLWSQVGPVSISLDVQTTETQTWTSCYGTNKATYPLSFIPVCWNNPGTGLIGTFKGKNNVGTITIDCSGTYNSYTYSATGVLTVSKGCAPPFTPSGTDWEKKFPPDNNLSDLSGSFQANVIRFIDAMRKAGISVRVVSTLRSYERAYLMHWSWLIVSHYPPPNGPVAPQYLQLKLTAV